MKEGTATCLVCSSLCKAVCVCTYAFVHEGDGEREREKRQGGREEGREGETISLK